MKTIALIDYGAGNLTSVRKGFAAAGAELFTPAAPAELARASAIVVPGVGHFASTEPLRQGWTEAIRTAVAAGTPLLGICLGLQWLYDGSEEAPAATGLGAVEGTCVRLPAAEGVKVPHVGWNSLHIVRTSRLLNGVDEGAFVYYTHSFAAPVTPDTVATSRHAREFAAVVERGAVFGVQFHPEKSADAGIRILRNFVSLVP